MTQSQWPFHAFSFCCRAAAWLQPGPIYPGNFKPHGPRIQCFLCQVIGLQVKLREIFMRPDSHTGTIHNSPKSCTFFFSTFRKLEGLCSATSSFPVQQEAKISSFKTLFCGSPCLPWRSNDPGARFFGAGLAKTKHVNTQHDQLHLITIIVYSEMRIWESNLLQIIHNRLIAQLKLGLFTLYFEALDLSWQGLKSNTHSQAHKGLPLRYLWPYLWPYLLTGGYLQE